MGQARRRELERLRMQHQQPRPQQAITPEQVAMLNAQRMAEQASRRQLRRDTIAGIVLNGICAGLYSQTTELKSGFGDRAVQDAVGFADRLIAALDAPPPAPPAEPAPASEPATEQPAEAADTGSAQAADPATSG